MIGDGAVGKSSITIRTCYGKFDRAYISTIGVEFGTKSYTIEGQEITMQVWDTAGQERFRFLQAAYYRGAHGALLVYDVTRTESLKNISGWIDDLVNNIDQTIPMILVGNKCDLDMVRAVPEKDGESLAEKISDQYNRIVPFYETSAKTNQNVEELFLKLGTMMLEERLFEAEKAVEWKERVKSEWW